MDAMSFVLIKDVTKRFGTVTAVDNISLTVKKGEIFGLVGSDGAGKSTLLRMAATMIPPESGSISIKGLDVTNNRMEVKGIMGYMPQKFGLYQDLTVNENMEFFMDIFGIFGDERKRRLERYLGFSNLLPFLDRQAGKLSGGMKQKLGLACVLVHEPEVLILDEPTNGVDPVSRMEFWDILFSMKGQGMTIMVSTSYLDEGEKCDRIALMHKSRIIHIDNPDNMKQGFKDLEEAVIERIKTADNELAEAHFAV
jgi:ABC-2 type transport system ATP-binding protein